MSPVPDWDPPRARRFRTPAPSARAAHRPHEDHPVTGELVPCGATGAREPVPRTSPAEHPTEHVEADTGVKEIEPNQRLVFAPDVSEGDQRLLTRFRSYCLPYNEPRPARTIIRPSRQRPLVTAARRHAQRATVYAGAAMIVRLLRVVPCLDGRAASSWWVPQAVEKLFVLVALWQTVLLALVALEHLAQFGQAEVGQFAEPGEERAAVRAVVLHRQYIDPVLDLNAAGRRLLTQARAAADQAADCGFGPNTTVGVWLAERVWRLARELADTSVWEREIERAEQAIADAGEEIDADTAARRRALDSSYRAFTERAEEIEAHARGRENLHLRRRAREAVARMDPHMLIKLAADRAVRDEDEKRELAELGLELKAELEVCRPQPVGDRDWPSDGLDPT